MAVNLSDYGASGNLLAEINELGRIVRVDRGECDVIVKDGKIRVISDSSRSQSETAPATGPTCRGGLAL